MPCPKCGRENPEELVECEHCGELLVDLSFGSASSSPDGHELPPRSGSSSVIGGTPHPISEHTGVFPRFTRFGDRYEILELLGEGGMGRVYRARDVELDKVIALKTIRGEKGGDPAVVQRFKQELLLARQITHKNVVRIYDLGEADGVKFFTMELIEGKNLKQVLLEREKLPLEEALGLLRQILGGLEEAHRQGVVHRDLKPQNIMLDGEDAPHIMDFGIARSADSSSLTATGSVLGTPDYMSPEQVRGENTDAQSDLFSLGVIAYQLLTGQLPYEADTPLAKVMMRVSQNPRPLRDHRPDIPAYLDAMVLKCMEMDRALRYRSASEILADLDRQQVDRSYTRRVGVALRNHRAGLSAAAGLVIVLGAGIHLFNRAEPVSDAEAVQENVVTVAILPFTNATGSAELDWMRTGLPEMLATDLSQSKFVRPVPTERVTRLLRELGVRDQARFDEATIEAVSVHAPAESVLYGQFVESGGRMRLDLSLRRAGTGVPTPIKVEESDADVFAAVDQITRRVKEQLDLTPEQLRGDTDHPVARVSTASVDALRAYQAGLLELRQGANQAAIPHFRDAVARDPRFALAYSKLAEAFLNARLHADAEEAVRTARELSETRPLALTDRYYIHALAARVDDDYQTAVDSYRELAKLYPDDPDIHLSLAAALEELGHLPEAMKTYARVVEIAPGYGAALLGLGRTQLFSGQPDAAIRTVQAGLENKQFEDDLESLGMLQGILGSAYRDRGEFDEAIEHLKLSFDYRRRTGDRRGMAVSLTNLASIYEQRGEIRAALDAEEEAVRLAREAQDLGAESVALLNLGLTHKVAGNLDEALSALRASLRIEQERQDEVELATRLDHVADVYRVRGQYDDALVYLEQARTHLDRSGDRQEKANNLLLTGTVHKAQGGYEKAAESLLGAIALFQEIEYPLGVAFAQTRLAELYASQGRYVDALRMFEEALSRIEDTGAVAHTADVKIQWGHVLLDLGAWNEAEEAFRDARETVVQFHIEEHVPRLLLGEGRLAQARSQPAAAEKIYRAAEAEARSRDAKESWIESQALLGSLARERGELGRAVTLLAEAREQASRARLRPVEARIMVELAHTSLDKGDLEAARALAVEAVERSERWEGRVIELEASVILGRACEEQGLRDPSTRAFAKARELWKWIVDNVPPERVDTFTSTSRRKGLRDLQS